MNGTPPVICLDASLPGRRDSIAVFLIPGSKGAVLIDCGPGSTKEILTASLKKHHYRPEDIAQIFLTHIHLDHAGAAGWFASKGAQVFVHPAGVIHMHKPEKLLASARRIYGDSMDILWGEFLPVPSERLFELKDGEEIPIDKVPLKVFYTPGHAEHHISYEFSDTCLSGDVAGLRKPGCTSVNMPIVPPETHLPRWMDSLAKLQGKGYKNLALSHYGFISDVDEHLSRGIAFIHDVSLWLEKVNPGKTDLSDFKEKYKKWLQRWAISNKWNFNDMNREEFILDVKMGAVGLYRYWKSVRMAGEVI